MLPRLLIVCLLAATLIGCSDNPGCGKPQDGACTRVLFIGNSYTYVNDLPGMFTHLARVGGHKVETDMAASGGWTLADHEGSSATLQKLTSRKWDVVVLQEQSQIPSVGQMREQQMYPAARQLVETIRFEGARPMFFVTWARRDGWPENALPDYASMQSAIDDGYLTIAAEEHAAVAPVGEAWLTVLQQEKPSALWQEDGSHPTTEGTYLAACVFYAAIFGKSPKGLGYHADLSSSEAAKLQKIASETVLQKQLRNGA